MEWSKAKNFILILLVAVNVILLLLNIIKFMDNTVSTDRIKNIMNICEKNDIEINCQLPSDIMPAPQLFIRKYDYDYVRLQQIFFGSITDVKRTSDLTNVIFTKGNEKMTVENSRVVFTTDKKDYAPYVKGLGELLGEFSAERKSGDTIYFFKTYREIPVFSNYICIDTVNDRLNIILNYSSVLRPVGNKQNIIGSDEAIYCAINRICSDIKGERAITAVEKGYYDSRTALSDEGAIPLVYAIYVNNEIYYVNAYNGSCYK